MRSDKPEQVKFEYSNPNRIGVRYLWLKEIRAVDLTQHCMACLIGPRHMGVDPRKREAEWLAHPKKETIAYYLCAVTADNNMRLNGHLLAFPAEGEIHEHSSGLMRVKVTNLRPVEITPDYIDPERPHAKERLYCRCRNYQAANMLHVLYGAKDYPNPENYRYARPSRAKTIPFDY